MKKPKTEDHGSFTFIDRRGVNKKEVKVRIWEENVKDKFTDKELTVKAGELLKSSPCNFPSNPFLTILQIY